MIYDGYFTRGGGTRTDALLVELLGRGGSIRGRIIQAYRPSTPSRLPLFGKAKGFALLDEPLVDDRTGIDDAEAVLLEGAREHPDGERLFGASTRGGDVAAH